MAELGEKERAIATWMGMRRSRRHRRRIIVTAVVLVGAVVVAAVVLTTHHFQTVGTPQTVAALPPPPNTTHLRDHSCYGQDWEPRVNGGGGGRVTVDAHPISAVVYWLPGTNSTRCRAVVTKLTESQAISVAQAVRHTHTPDGSIACPNDTGSVAWVFFRYAGRGELDVLSVQLSGCNFASAPRRGSIGPAWQVAGLLQRWQPAGLSDLSQ